MQLGRCYWQGVGVGRRTRSSEQPGDFKEAEFTKTNIDLNTADSLGTLELIKDDRLIIKLS